VASDPRAELSGVDSVRATGSALTLLSAFRLFGKKEGATSGWRMVDGDVAAPGRTPLLDAAPAVLAGEREKRARDAVSALLMVRRRAEVARGGRAHRMSGQTRMGVASMRAKLKVRMAMRARARCAAQCRLVRRDHARRQSKT